MAQLYVFDLDGTLADVDHRLHFIHRDKPDWKAFFQACEEDTPIGWTIGLLNKLYNTNGNGDRVVILTGRSARVQDKTRAWLERHGVRYHELVMRPINDFRSDSVCKQQLLDDYLHRNPGMEVAFIVEDRQKVVDMWRGRGFNVLQCDAWPEAEARDVKKDD